MTKVIYAFTKADMRQTTFIGFVMGVAITMLILDWLGMIKK